MCARLDNIPTLLVFFFFKINTSTFQLLNVYTDLMLIYNEKIRLHFDTDRIDTNVLVTIMDVDIC